MCVYINDAYICMCACIWCVCTGVCLRVHVHAYVWKTCPSTDVNDPQVSWHQQQALLTCGAWCVDVGHGSITCHPLPHSAVWLHRKSSHHQQVKVLHACRNLAGREPLHIHRQSLQIFKNATDCNEEVFTCTASCFCLLLIYNTSCLCTKTTTKKQTKSSTSVYVCVCVCVCVCVHFTNVGLDIQ